MSETDGRRRKWNKIGLVCEWDSHEKKSSLNGKPHVLTTSTVISYLFLASMNRSNSFDHNEKTTVALD